MLDILQNENKGPHLTNIVFYIKDLKKLKFCLLKKMNGLHYFCDKISLFLSPGMDKVRQHKSAAAGYKLNRLEH